MNAGSSRSVSQSLSKMQGALTGAQAEVGLELVEAAGKLPKKANMDDEEFAMTEGNVHSYLPPGVYKLQMRDPSR